MIISGAPFIVPQHEHDVDLAIATVVPLIFLTTLQPDVSGEMQVKQLQYAMRAFAIITGFAALIMAFLQLAGEETVAGTVSGMILLLASALCAVCGMAWPIVVGLGRFSVLLAGLTLSVAVGFGPFIGAIVFYYLDHEKSVIVSVTFYLFCTGMTILILRTIFVFMKISIRMGTPGTGDETKPEEDSRE
jgi:hypothetical protein